MGYDIGIYQISFKNVNSSDLKDIEVGVFPITRDIYGDFSKKYGINFAGPPLEFKKFFGLNQDQISKNQKQTYQYKYYRIFIKRYKTFQTPKDSILTITLNSRTGIMIFLLILHQWNIYVM
jgi:hypothetical protein